MNRLSILTIFLSNDLTEVEQSQTSNMTGQPTVRHRRLYRIRNTYTNAWLYHNKQRFQNGALPITTLVHIYVTTYITL